MELDRRASLLGLAALLSGCGGGGGGGGTAPAPAPVPVPPPPPPPQPATTPIRATAFGEGVAFFIINPTPPDSATALPQGQSWSSADGIFRGLGVQALFGYSGTSAGFDATGDLSRYPKQAAIIDKATAQYLIMEAPANATVVSPATWLMFHGLEQDRLKRAFSLRNSLLEIGGDPDLTRFDVVPGLRSGDIALRAPAEQAVGGYMRMLVTAAAWAQAASNIDPNRMLLLHIHAAAPLARYLQQQSDAPVIVQDNMVALLRAAEASAPSPSRRPYLPQVIEAAATMAANYSLLVQRRGDDPGTAAGVLGIRAVLLPMMHRLLSANTVAAADASFDERQIEVMRARIAFLRSVPPYREGRFVQPLPAFYDVPRDGTLEIAPDSASPNPVRRGFWALHMTQTGFTLQDLTLTGVNVPADRRGEISATLAPDGTVRVAAAPGFAGQSFLETNWRHAGGEEATGRVFVNVG